jgi:uncharacterized repeat protein (TIGR01451 family)
VPQSTTIDGNSISDDSPLVCQNDPLLVCPAAGNCEATVGGACTAFPFVKFRSLTSSGTGPLPLPLPSAGQIVVRFRLKASLPLEYDAPTNGDVDATVQLDPAADPDELPHPHATAGLSQPNEANGTVTMSLPDLVATNSSLDIDGGVVDPGDLLEYTLTVSNIGTDAARNVVLVDAIPADTTYVAGTITQDSDSRTDPVDADNADYDGTNPGAITVNVGTLPSGGSTTITLRVLVDEQAADGAVVENQATVAATCLDDRVTDSTEVAHNDALELGNDPDDPFDDDSVKDQVVSRAEIAVVKNADRSTAEVGETVGYGYALSTGGGNVRLHNVSVSDDLCAPVAYQNGDINSDGYLDWSDSGSGAETWIYQCSYVVQSTDPVGPLVNTATARGVAPSSGQVTEVDGATVTIVNTPPTAVDDPTATPTDTPLAVDVLANDSDANGHLLAITSVQNPTDQGGSAGTDENGTPGDSSDDFVSYNPPPGFSGIDTFTYVIDDGFGGTDAATVTVTVGTPAPVLGDNPRFLEFDGEQILWSEPAAATGYHLYRGDLAAVRSSGVYAQDPQSTPNAERLCWLDDTSHEDSFDPPAGQVVFYLVTADDGNVESGLGEDSEGIARPNDNPCR